MPVADSIDTAQDFARTLFYVYLALIFAYIITSWIPLPYNVWLNRIQRFIYDVVDPYIRLFRRFVPQLSMGALSLKLSPIVAILVLYALNAVIQQGIEALR